MHRASLVLAFTLVLPAVLGLTVTAPARETANPLQALRWRCIGPFRGGRTVAVSGVNGDARRFYFGAAGGGVWRTDDAGQTWRPVFDREPVASIGAIAVAPSDANVVYVGTGEADLRSDLQQGNGMYRSADGGATWQRAGLTDTRAIGRISVNPHDADDLVVAAVGHPYGPNADRGVFRSLDGGRTWRKTLYRNADTGAITVARDPQHPEVLFAALLQTRRPPWNVYAPSKGPGSGLYRSADGGTTWSAVHGGGFPSAGLGRIGVAIAPNDAQRIYAIIDAKDGGLYRSDDGGVAWKRLDADRRLWQRGWYFEEVAVDPRDPDTVYVSNTSLYRSTDGGATFSAIKGAPGGDDYHMLWIDPSTPERMILASDQGAVVSVDGARSWSSWYNQPTAQLYHVATDGQFPFWVYGAQQDSGAIGVASRSSRRGITQADTLPLDVGGESDPIAPDPLHPGVLFGARVVREDLRTHSVRDVSPVFGSPDVWRNTWTLPLVFSAADPRALYFSHQALFRTLDGGSSWQTISPDLTRSAPGIPANLDAPAAADRDEDRPAKAAPRGVIYTIAPSPLQARTIWVGTDDGNIALTRDGGASWRNGTPRGLPAWSKIGTLEASHFAVDTAYAAVDRHRLDDLRPYIARTRDGGRTWRTIVNGIPDGSFVNAVREDPQRRGLLYAATETGVYVSFDDGDAWRSLQLNLPTASVRDLTVRDDALVIATHGRSFWVLDDLSPLRQYDERVAAAQAWLFTPLRAYRIRNASDEGTPLPPEVAAGDNPPEGAILDYLVPDGTRKVRLDILDASGAGVRRWSSADTAAPPDPKTLEFPPFWAPAQSLPGIAPGLHRFVWDLHESAPTSPAPDEAADPFAHRGIWALPGTYTVRLDVDGRVIERLLRVELDPRESATAADLQAQHAFSRSIETLRAAVRTAAAAQPHDARLGQIDAVLGPLERAVQSAPAAPTTAQRTAFAAAAADYATVAAGR